MKSKIVVFLLFTILLFHTSCKKNDDVTSSQLSLLDGPWRITLFHNNGNNDQPLFEDYNFNFFSSDSVVAIKDTVVISGTYTLGIDNTHQTLMFNFGTQIPLEQLNENWHILEKTGDTFHLQFHNQGNGANDLIIFSRK